MKLSASSKERIFNLAFIVITLAIFEAVLHHPFFNNRMHGIQTLLTEYRYFANWKPGDRLFPSEKMFDREIGWRAGPRITVTGKKEHINAQGWRSRNDFGLSKTKKRVIVLGDSFFYGQDLNDEETLHYQLQEKLGNEYEVMNFAVDGYSWDQIYTIGTRLVPRYSPDWVIIGVIDDDFSLERSCLPIAWGRNQKPYYKVTQSGIEARNIPVPTPQEALKLHSTPWIKGKDKFISLLSEISLVRMLGVPITRYEQTRCIQDATVLLKDLTHKLNLGQRLVIAEANPLPSIFRNEALRLNLRYELLSSKEKEEADRSGLQLDTTDGFHPGHLTNALGSLILSRVILEADKRTTAPVR